MSLAFSTRFTRRHAPLRAHAIGDILRLTAMLGLLAQAPAAVVSWLILASDGDLFFGLIAFAQSAAVVTFLILLTGRVRVARVFAAVALAVSLYGVVPSVMPAGAGGMLGYAIAIHVGLWAALACLFAGFNHSVPRPPYWVWTIALIGIMLFTAALVFAHFYQVPVMAIADPFYSDLGWVSGRTFAVATLGFLLARHHLADHGLRWTSALAIMGWSMLPARVIVLELAVAYSFITAVVAATQLLALLAGTVVLSRIGIRAYRRLPPPTTFGRSST